MKAKRTPATITFTPDQDGKGVSISVVYGTPGVPEEVFQEFNPAHGAAHFAIEILSAEFEGEKVGRTH